MELEMFTLCVFLNSILATYTLALIERNRENLGTLFKGVSLSPEV